MPLNTAVTYDETKPFAHELARILERSHSDLVVSDMKKTLRVGKILVDWSQNDNHKTTVRRLLASRKIATYGFGACKWEEVEACLKKKDPKLLEFTADQVLSRVEKFGDLFEPLVTMKQKLPAIEKLKKLDSVEDVAPAEKRKRAAPKERQKVARKPAAKRTGRKSRK